MHSKECEFSQLNQPTEIQNIAIISQVKQTISKSVLEEIDKFEQTIIVIIYYRFTNCVHI